MEEGESNETPKYGIINYKLLEDLVIQQAPKGEAGRLFREDGVKLEEVKELRIEFLNIISLEHLWPMRNIRKLTLSHNCVERIEKLEDLVELRELDLSFNRINAMTGLRHLINLEILVLSGNDIQTVEGIDNLRSLKILSLANNKIDSWDHVMYLRKFKQLRSLNVKGNPCIHQTGFIDYVMAFIPQLTYFSYRMITDEQKSKSRKIHRLSIAKAEESETNLLRSEGQTKAVEEKREKDFAAFVENLDEGEFFKLLFQRDEEDTIFEKVNTIAEAASKNYGARVNEISRELYEFGKSKEAERAKELAMFQKTIDDEQNLVKTTARRLMNEIEERRIEILDNLTKKSPGDTSDNHSDKEAAVKIPEGDSALSLELMEAQKTTEEFNKFLSSKWTKLMYNEVVLHEQMEDLLESFKSNMSSSTGEFIDFVKDRFSCIRQAEDAYQEDLAKIVDSYKKKNSLTEGTIPENEETVLLNAAENRESLTESLGSSHEFRLHLIDSRQSTMIERVESWLQEVIDKLESSENSRHRSRILEISHYLQFQRESLEDVFQFLNINIDKTIEADVAAALDE